MLMSILNPVKSSATVTPAAQSITPTQASAAAPVHPAVEHTLLSSAPDLSKMVGVWVHETFKAVPDLRVIKSLGFDYALIKIADGARAFQPTARDIIWHNAMLIGLPLVAWAYVYPTSSISGQIDVIAQSLPKTCQHLVLDVEIEWESGDYAENVAKAHALCHGIAQATGHRVKIHLSSFVNPTMHSQIPYAAFLSHCASFMPQAYQEGETPLATVMHRLTTDSKSTAKAASVPVIPTINVPGLAPLVKQAGYPGYNVWLYDGVVLSEGTRRAAGDDMGVKGYAHLWSPALNDRTA